MSPPGSAHPVFSLGLLTIIGGAAGYARKGSKASLIAGVGFGGLLIGSGVLISGEHQYEGHVLASATSGMMGLGMGHRFLKSGKFMPSGLVAALGAGSAAFNVMKAVEWKP